MQSSGPTVAVVGHVEWVQFARVAHVPRAGEVVHAEDAFGEPAGGGAVAAVQLARLAGSAALVTRLGEDDLGARSRTRLGELGVDVRASSVQSASRSAVTLVDDAGERTITTFGRRLEPGGAREQERWAGLERSMGCTSRPATRPSCGSRARARARWSRARVPAERSATALRSTRWC